MKQVWYCFLVSPANRLLWNLVSGVRGPGWGGGGKGLGCGDKGRVERYVSALPFSLPGALGSSNPFPCPSP